MNKIKAVILETTGSRCTVLADDGSFRSLPNSSGAQVGEEIELDDTVEVLFNDVNPIRKVRKSRRAWQALAAAAALLLLTLTVALGWNFAQASTAVALVSIDINPSIELALNAREQVVRATAVNSDGEKVLQALELKNQPVPVAMSKILEQAQNLGYLTDEHSWILVGLAPNGNKELPPALEEAVKSAGAAIQEKVNARMAVFQLSEPERIKAEQAGVSIGEYALWQSADKAGIKIEAQELKTKTERVRLLEAPEIQAQVLKDKGVLQIPGTQGKNDSAIKDMPERDQDKDKDQDKDQNQEKEKEKEQTKNNEKDRANLKQGQERSSKAKEDDERESTANRASLLPDKSGKQNSPVTELLTSDDEETDEQERGSSPQKSIPVLSPNSPAPKPQANENDGIIEGSQGGDQELEAGKTTDDESERERSGKEQDR